MNQDYMYTSEAPIGNLPNLYILADGMGGHNAGDYASRYTVETIVKSVQNSLDSLYPFWKKPSCLSLPFYKFTNIHIYAYVNIRTYTSSNIEKAETDIDLEGMGTTVVAATFSGQELCVARHVGQTIGAHQDSVFRF